MFAGTHKHLNLDTDSNTKCTLEEAMIYILYTYFTFFLFTWYSSKLLKDVSGRNQYWHTPQMIFLINVYLLPYVATRDFNILLTTFALGLQFPFIFNSGLNLYRRLPINHLGEYDFLKFYQTIILLIIGITLLILQKG